MCDDRKKIFTPRFFVIFFKLQSPSKSKTECKPAKLDYEHIKYLTVNNGSNWWICFPDIMPVSCTAVKHEIL